MALVGRLGFHGSHVEEGVSSAVIGSAATLVLASIAVRIFSSRKTGIVTGALAALNPVFFLPPREPLFQLLWLSSGFLLIVSVDRPSSGCGLLAGVALALAAVVCSSAIIFGPLLAAPLFDRRFPSAIRRALAGSAIFGFGLVFLPATIGKAISYPTGGAPPSAIVLIPAVWCLALAALASLGFIAADRHGVRILAVAALALSFVSRGAAYGSPILILYASAGISRLTARPVIA